MKKLYFITDNRYCSGQQFLDRIEKALKAGVNLLQLREKDISSREYLERARAVKKIANKYNTPFIIDDRADIALLSGADGVHVGGEDIEVCDARKIMGEGKIVGATAKTVERALECERMGADYLGVGTIFNTTTKVKTTHTSLETLKKIKESVSVDVYAIGGLCAENIDVLSGIGIDGICVVSAIMGREDSDKAVEGLRRRMEEVL